MSFSVPIPSRSVSSVVNTCDSSDEEEESSSALNITILDGKFFKLKSIQGKICIGTCMLCLPKIVEIKGYGTSSTNFRSHLQRRHGMETINEYKEYAKNIKGSNVGRSNITAISNSSKRNKNNPSTTNKKREKFNEAVVKFIIDGMVPLRIVENKYFKEMFSVLEIENTGIDIFSRRTLGRKIDDYNLLCEQKIKVICAETTYICTTCDIWSGRKRSFLGVTMHWITDKYQRKSLALACRRFRNSHSAERIAFLLKQIYDHFGLSNSKIVATVTDNASNFIKAFRLYGVKSRLIHCESSDYIFSNEPLTSVDSSDSEHDNNDANETNVNTSDLSRFLSYHIRCCTHTLSLCVSKDGIKAIQTCEEMSIIHNNVLKKCNLLWKSAARPKTAEIILDVLGHSLSRPIETRWNSLYDSLKEIAAMKAKSSHLCMALNLKYALNEEDFRYITEHLECTKPFADLIDILQAENNIFFGILLPSLLSLNNKLQILSQRDFMHCRPLVSALQASVQQPFEELFSFNTELSQKAAIAAFSYPRFKRRWLQSVTVSHRDYLQNMFKDAVTLENPEFQTVVLDTANETTQDDDAFFDFEESSFTSVPFSDLSTIELQIQQYFNDPSRDLESLEKYPVIKRTFYKFNTPLPSSAPVERLFSYATMTNLPKANKLADSFFEKRVILKANMASLD